MEADSTPTYLYVQFESLQNGYIDDVEFGFDGRQIAVRYCPFTPLPCLWLVSCKVTP